jgi:hypothetical protein
MNGERFGRTSRDHLFGSRRILARRRDQFSETVPSLQPHSIFFASPAAEIIEGVEFHRHQPSGDPFLDKITTITGAF